MLNKNAHCSMQCVKKVMNLKLFDCSILLIFMWHTSQNDDELFAKLQVQFTYHKTIRSVLAKGRLTVASFRF